MNVLVISTEEYLTLRLLKCLAETDAAVHVFGSGRTRALRASRHCRRYTAFEPATLTRADVDRYCARYAIDVVLPSGMASGFLLSAWEGGLAAPALPMPPTELLRMLNDKWRFSRFLQQNGLPFPPSRLLERPEDARSLDLPFPVIVKPLDLDAGRGVARCDTREDVQAYLKRPDAALPLLVQEYVPGADVGLGLLVREGEILAWTIQRQRPEGGGVEFIADAGILEIGRQIVRACRYDGIAHFDLRLDERDGTAKVLECNPRFWASLPFCSLAGVNFADLGIRLALGRPLPAPAYRTISLTFPSRALASGRRLSEPTRRALRATLADPLPLVLLGAGKVQRKVESLFVRH